MWEEDTAIPNSATCLSFLQLKPNTSFQPGCACSCPPRGQRHETDRNACLEWPTILQTTLTQGKKNPFALG